MSCSRLRARAIALCGVIGAALLLSACWTHNVSKEFQFKPDATKGLVFASVTVSGSRPSQLFMKYRKVGGKGDIEMQQIPVITSAITVPMDWDPKGALLIPDNNPVGRLMAIELPAGRYEFYAWHGSIPGFSIWSATPFSYQFESIAGRALYVGNMHLRFDGQRYRMGILDSRERDVPLMRQKVPKVREDQVDIKMMEVTKVNAAK